MAEASSFNVGEETNAALLLESDSSPIIISAPAANLPDVEFVQKGGVSKQ